MIHPYEEEISYEVYKLKIPTFKDIEFEKFYAQNINQNSLLMTLKLSNDQDKIIRVLKNESFDDELYLKILKLYDWKGEGLFDNDNNRDVTITFIKRFFKAEYRVDPSTLYSPVNLSKIVAESKDQILLDTLLYIPNYQFNTSKKSKSPKNTRELIANNHYSHVDTLKRLLSFKDDDIDFFLAKNSSIDEDMQESIYKRGVFENLLNLATNQNLSDKLFFLLLENKDIAPTLLEFAKIDKDRFEKARAKEEFYFIAKNENIGEFIDTLLTLNDKRVDLFLAQNPATKLEHLQFLFKKDDKDIDINLSKNINISDDLAYKLYKKGIKDIELNLSANPSTPKDILIELFNKDEHEINIGLAQNSSMPLYYLQQLQLDSKLMHYLSKNRTFTDKILNNLGI